MSDRRVHIGRGGRPQVSQTGRKGWTRQVQDIFFEELAATANVDQSLRKAGMSRAGAYAKRARDADFRMRWRRAVSAAVERLELALLERTLTGTARTVTARDGTVTRTVEYPDRIALSLIKQHQPTLLDARSEDAAEEAEAARERLLKKLDRMVARMAREAAGGRVGSAGCGE